MARGSFTLPKTQLQFVQDALLLQSHCGNGEADVGASLCSRLEVGHSIPCVPLV